MRNLIFIFLGFFIIGCANSTPGVGGTSAEDNFNARAVAVLTPKCNSGNFSACNDLAISYQNLQNHQKAFEVYDKNCRFGYQKSCANLANMYMNGNLWGMKKDEKKAVEIYQTSCMNQGADSCYFLGDYYRSDVGKAPNYALALDAYSRGCNLGDMNSCTNTGLLYEFGLGVKKDEVKAMQIYRSSCLSGESTACDSIKRLQNR